MAVSDVWKGGQHHDLLVWRRGYKYGVGNEQVCEGGKGRRGAAAGEEARGA